MALIYVVLLVMSGLFFMQPEYEAANENEQLLFDRIENGIYRQQERALLDDLIQTYSVQDHQKGLNMIFSILELAIEQDIDTLRFDCHRSLGFIYSQIGIADRSLEHSLLAKHFYERIGDSGNFNWALVNIGNTYYWQDMPDLALRYYTDARKGFEQMTRAIGHDDENERTRRTGIDGLAVSLNNIALCNVKKEDYLKAVGNHEKAHELRKQMDSPILEAHSYSYIGHLYSLMGDADKAIKYYSAALQILTDPASVDDSDIPLYSSILAFTYRRMGNHYGRNGEIEDAGKYFDLAIDLYRLNGNDKELINTWLSMIDFYIKGSRLADALSFTYNALEVATEHAYLQDKILALNKLSSIYSSQGDFESAYEFTRRKNKTDSLLYRNYTDVVMLGVEKEISSRIQYEDMQALRQENIINKMNLSRQKTVIIYLILISVLGITLLVVFLYLFYMKRKTNHQLEIMNRDMHDVNKRLIDSESNLAKINDKLNRKNNSLIKSEQNFKDLNRTKDKFFSILAHDLRGPISNLMQISELLTERYDSMTEEKKKKFTHEISKSTKGLFDLVETLLLWSQSQQGAVKFQPENIDIHYVINNNMEIFNLMAKNKNLSFISSLPENIHAYADVNMVNTILRNLISNAIKYSNYGGKIGINAGIFDGYAEISVIDNGIGMPSEIREELFKIEPSESQPGTNGERGTGLGLVICKELAEQQGGAISVESEPGKGSSFTFLLPARNN